MPGTKTISLRCPLHVDKMRDVYCHTCEQAICLRCLFANHRHHDCTELEMAVRRKREILRRLARAIADLLFKLNASRDALVDVTTRARNLRERIGNDIDVVLHTPGLRRRYGDITGTETDITKMAGWPEPGADADRLNQYLASQQTIGFKSGQPCMMCPSQIPCTQPREGLLMICHCKHPPAEAQAQD